MRRSVLLIIALILGTSSFFLYNFKGCAGCDSSFDGERKSNMMSLTGSYYYNKSDKQIWQREETTDSYKKITNASTDSLIWDNSNIIGFANKQYFISNLKTSEYKTLTNKSVISKIIRKNYKHLVREVPALVIIDEQIR